MIPPLALPSRRPPASTIGPSSVPTGFGQATTLAQARALVSFSFAVPHDARLGEADLVTLDRSVGNGLVTLWWHPSPRVPLPASPTEPAWGLAFSALRGSVSDISFTKLLPPGSVVVPLTVNGDPGYWIEGTPHAVAITTNGEFSTVTNRLATNTLLWQHGDVTYRLEAHIDRELAVSIAGTLA